MPSPGSAPTVPLPTGSSKSQLASPLLQGDPAESPGLTPGLAICRQDNDSTDNVSGLAKGYTAISIVESKRSMTRGLSTGGSKRSMTRGFSTGGSKRSFRNQGSKLLSVSSMRTMVMTEAEVDVEHEDPAPRSK